MREGREFAYTRRDFERVCALIRQRAGIALAPGKEDMVYGRLARRLRHHGLQSFADYLDLLANAGEEEWTAFTNALTTNLTSFFREAHHFKVLKEHLQQCGDRRVLLWCAASSTGEEPYSMAMTLCEHFGSLRPNAAILATDIDTNVLDVGARGVYPIERLEKMSDERKRKFFRRGRGAQEGYCKVIDELRSLITFRQLNLLDRHWGLRGPFDAIFCRNVMIYFDKPTQYQILQKMLPLLTQDGLFFAGHSESFFHATDLITSIGHTVYVRARRKVEAAPGERGALAA
ncbi:MAG TPA: CheR family methyltransferase [Nevskiaceae bacterium]|nr:CheR family methyltransferase [Nevskiaceae bacterium]